jgi:hypothetical protein
MRRLAIFVIPLLVAGCALPPVYSLASFAADGISYVATGKSTTDHALSIVAGEDCAMLRALKEEAICVPGRGVPALGPVAEAPVRAPSPRLGDDAGGEPRRTDGPALVLVQKDAVAAPTPARAPQLVEKSLPVPSRGIEARQFAEKGFAAPRPRAGIFRKIGPIVSFHCAQAGGMGPARQCALGPDA